MHHTDERTAAAGRGARARARAPARVRAPTFTHTSCVVHMSYRTAISTKLMKVFGGGKLIGPLLIGLGLPIEVAPLRASTSEILNLASIASYSSGVIDYSN